MLIKWLGHSSFRLEESTGTVIVTDPYQGDFPEVSADAVTVSHLHKGHNNYGAVSGNPSLLNKTGAFEIMGIHILSAQSSHGNNKGGNLIFMFRIDGVDICHLGDIGEKCNVRLMETIGEVDVLLIPISGHNTIDADQAKEYIDRLMPDIVIPMEGDGESLDYFLSLFDDEDIEYLEGDTIEVDRAQFQGECTKIVVFKK